MNLAGIDIDDEIIALFDDTGKTDDQHELDTPFPLPSELNKSAQRPARSATKKRRRPAQKPTINIEALLTSNSPKENADDDDDGPFVIRSDREDIVPAPAKTQVVAHTEPPRVISPIEVLESRLTQYIQRGIDKVRRDFVDEFNQIFSNTTEEESIITRFIVSLPRDVDGCVASGISDGLQRVSLRSDGDKVATNVATLMDPLSRIVPRNPHRSVSVPTLGTLSETVQDSANRLELAIEQMLDNIKSERTFFQPEVSEWTAGLSLNAADSNSVRQIEAEANGRRLEIEREFFEARRKQFEEAQQEWREIQVRSNPVTNPAKTLLDKLTELGSQVPNSRFRTGLNSLRTLVDDAKRTREELNHVRTQLDIARAVFPRPMKEKPNRTENELSPSVVERSRELLNRRHHRKSH